MTGADSLFPLTDSVVGPMLARMVTGLGTVIGVLTGVPLSSSRSR